MFPFHRERKQFFLFFCLFVLGLIALPYSRAHATSPIVLPDPISVRTDEMQMIPSILYGNTFCISSTPAIGDVSQGFFQGHFPGLTSIFYKTKNGLKKDYYMVTGLTPENPIMISGYQLYLKPVGFSLEDTIAWSSSKPDIATVDFDGLVTANDSGTVTITCVTKDHRTYQTVIDIINEYEANVQKAKEEENVILSSEESTLLMKQGDKYRITVNARQGYHTVSSTSLTWTSSDNSVASVDGLGNVKAKSDGYAEITCAKGETSISFSVNVITNGESGKSCKLTLLAGNDAVKRNYTLFKQNAHNYASYDRYLAWHGCAHCSLATVLGAYNEKYEGILPNEIISGIEKKYAPEEDWYREHHEHNLPHQMPITLHAISEMLKKEDVNNDYIEYFSYDQARADMIAHLKTGNPVIFEVRQKSAKTHKKSRRWTNSYHTMIFLGVYTDNRHILLCDSVDRGWYNGGQRYKIVTIDDVMEYMFPCTSSTTSYYYVGGSSDGGYIKVYDK